MGCQPIPRVTTQPYKETTYPITITDDLGRMVTIEKEPMKIVSLAPSNTEVAFALGLDDRLVGVTEFCDYPEGTLAIEKVGGYDSVDIEKVVTINPDLILATDFHKHEFIPQLEKLGFTVVGLVPKTLDEVMDSIIFIGRITGTQEAAYAITAGMEQRIETIANKAAGITEADRLRVLYLVWHEPIMSVGNDTRIHEMIEIVGGSNVAAIAGEGYPTLALEEILSINPEVIVANVEDYEGGDISLQFVFNEPRLSGISALINQRVYGIDADLTNRPTSRMIDGLEQLASMIHPEIFGPIE
jgi:iron complex transport system substrate-binding protein